MPKASKGKFYAVKKGRKPGVYSTWAECFIQINGFSGSQYKSFATKEEALAYAGLATDPSSSVASATTSTSSSVPYNPFRKPAAELKESDCEVVYTDGACHGNGFEGAVAGVGVWWGPDDPRNLSERCPGAQTNNRAELMAIVRVLETLPSPPPGSKDRPLVIKTDSEYAKNCITEWLPGWIRRDFKTTTGGDVKNKGLILYLSELLSFTTAYVRKVEFQWVKGHANVPGNEAADNLAGRGTRLPTLPERDWDDAIMELNERRSAFENTAFSPGQKRPQAIDAIGDLEDFPLLSAEELAAEQFD